MTEASNAAETKFNDEVVFAGYLFDGKTAEAKIVEVWLNAKWAKVTTNGTELLSINLPELVRHDLGPEQLHLAQRKYQDNQRILVEKSKVSDECWTKLLSISTKQISGRKKMSKIVATTIVIMLALYVIFAHLIPSASDRLAHWLPSNFETAFGNRIEGYLLDGALKNVCGSTGNSAELAKIATALQVASGHGGNLTVRIAKNSTANAFAIPDGRIFITDELLEIVVDQEDLLAVLAHEMGHVQAKHSLRIALRIGSTSTVIGFLLGDFTGSAAVVAIGQFLIGTAYSREFEREADQEAARILNKLQISPSRLSVILEQLMDEQRGGVLSTHPITSERLQFLRSKDSMKVEPEGTHYAPLPLSSEEWKTLKSICA